MTDAFDCPARVDEISLANDARLELAFAQFFDGLVHEASGNDEQIATDELVRANQDYLRAGYRRQYEYFTGVPLEAAELLKIRLSVASKTGDETIRQIRQDLRAAYANGSIGGGN